MKRKEQKMLIKTTSLIFALCMMGCVDLVPNVHTELGIGVYTNNMYYPDLAYTDAVYLAVCDCVGVDTDDYIGDFEIWIHEKKGLGGGWFLSDRYLFFVEEDQNSLGHELGHFFTNKLIGYDKIDVHAPESYEILCGDVLRIKEYYGK